MPFVGERDDVGVLQEFVCEALEFLRGESLVSGFCDCSHGFGAGERGVPLGEAMRADEEVEDSARVDVGLAAARCGSSASWSRSGLMPCSPTRSRH